MVDYVLPSPPIPPQNCTSPLPRVRQPSAAWLAAYFGQAPPNMGTGAGDDEMGKAYWPTPPPGRGLDYLGYQTVTNLDVFGLTVPADEIWHMHTVILDFTLGSDTGTRSLQLEVDGGENFDIFGDYGQTVAVTPSAGGNATWAQGVVNSVTKFNRFVSPLPAPFFLYGGWEIQALINVKPAGDTLNFAIFQYEAWQVVAAKGTGTGTGGTGTRGGFFDYYSNNPFFRLG